MTKYLFGEQECKFSWYSGTHIGAFQHLGSYCFLDNVTFIDKTDSQNLEKSENYRIHTLKTMVLKYS